MQLAYGDESSCVASQPILDSRGDVSIMNTTTIWTTFLAGSCTLFIWSPVSGDDQRPLMQASRALVVERGQSGIQLSDPAFDVYATAAAIGQAYASGDPALLSDVALQLAEGERVLFRPRRGITAAQMLKLAVNAATIKQDKESLARLAAFAALRQDNELAAQVTAAQKLAAVSRDTSNPLRVPIEAVDPEVYELIRYSVQKIDHARLTGDSRCLIALEEDIDTCIPDPFRADIKKLIADTRVALPDATDSNEELIRGLETFRAAHDADPAQQMLAGTSRQGAGSWWRLLEWWNQSRGEWFIDTNVYFAVTQPEFVWKREQTRFLNREKQLQGCRYQTRVTTVYSPVMSDRRYLRANCPPRPTATTGTTGGSSGSTKTTATMPARRGAHIDSAGKVFYNGKYIGKATKVTYQGRACWMFDGGLAAIYRFVNENKTHEKNLLMFPPS